MDSIKNKSNPELYLKEMLSKLNYEQLERFLIKQAKKTRSLRTQLAKEEK